MFEYNLPSLLSIEKLPSIEEIKGYNTNVLVEFIRKQKININDDALKIIYDEQIAGLDFIKLTEQKLRSYGMKGGPSTRISDIVDLLKHVNVNINYFFPFLSDNNNDKYITIKYITIIIITKYSEIHKIECKASYGKYKKEFTFTSTIMENL